MEEKSAHKHTHTICTKQTATSLIKLALKSTTWLKHDPVQNDE